MPRRCPKPTANKSFVDFGNLDLKMAALQKEIQGLDERESEGLGSETASLRRKEVKCELEKVVCQMNRISYQKGKVKWMKEGDFNTKFFHSLLNHRRSRTSICKLEREDGSVSFDSAQIEESIVDFYKELYSKPRERGWGIEGVEWCPIDGEMSLELDKKFSEEEIKKAVFECDGDKAPGPDGFTMAFYKECWLIIKDDLVNVFDEFFEGGVINGITNETYICLIPKKKDSIRVQDFRPISLITSLYKIIAKVLSNRLKKVMSSTIGESQNAFIGGRQILDCCLIANEVVDDLRSRKKRGWVFKVDFEKAYDNVDWDFLEFVLSKKGFGTRWRRWIRGCVSSVSFSVMINGRPRGKFKGHKGLRQGFLILANCATP